jgi:hypothetical protein
MRDWPFAKQGELVACLATMSSVLSTGLKVSSTEDVHGVGAEVSTTNNMQEKKSDIKETTPMDSNNKDNAETKKTKNKKTRAK